MSSDGATTTTTIVKSTISGNKMVFGGFGGGGLVNASSPSFTVRNSIIALNTVGTGSSDPDCSGAFAAAGLNLLTDLTGCSGFSSYIITPAPGLGPLAANGA